MDYSTSRAFIRSEAGAVTVDWVVLTAAAVGLGLATMTVVRDGVSDTSDGIDATLRGNDIIQTSFALLRAPFNTDFSNGASGWSGGTVLNLDGFGEVLALDGDETAEISLEVPEGAEAAVVTFDMIAADDMNDDPATVLINGTPVSIYRDDHGSVTVDTMDVEGVTVEISQHYTNEPRGSGTHGHDSRATYTITVENPGESLTFGVRSGADDGMADEFYAIDDVDISPA